MLCAGPNRNQQLWLFRLLLLNVNSAGLGPISHFGWPIGQAQKTCSCNQRCDLLAIRNTRIDNYVCTGKLGEETESAPQVFHRRKQHDTTTVKILPAARSIMGKATTQKSIIAATQLNTNCGPQDFLPSLTYRLAKGIFKQPEHSLDFNRATTRTTYDATDVHRKRTTLSKTALSLLNVCFNQRFICACPVIEARKFPPFEWIDAVVRLLGKGGWIILESYC